jgi:hypothetical protein
VLAWIKRRLQRRDLRPRIELTADGFAVVNPGGAWYAVRWASITKIAAYKRDLLTTDEIMLAIEVADSPRMVQEVSEEWENFAELFAPLEQRLGISPAWYHEIMIPAFETSFRVLFERPGRPVVEKSGEAAG